MLKNSEDFNILEGYVKMDNPLHKIKLPEPKDFTISFQFKDGEEVVFKEAKSLQDFIYKMDNLHELEKENMRLKELLKRCRDFIKYEVPDHCIDDVLIDKIDEVLNND